MKKIRIFKASKIFLLSLIVLILLVSVLSSIEIEDCWCTCKGTILNANGLKGSCMDSCGRACGGQTDCSSDCKNCCKDWCNDIGLIGGGLHGCLASCESTCELKKLVNEIISAILVASGIVAAIMIVIHGIRILTAQDPSSRDEAKKGILFVIFALAIIGIAGALVNLLMGRIIIAGKQDGGQITPTHHDVCLKMCPKGYVSCDCKTEKEWCNYRCCFNPEDNGKRCIAPSGSVGVCDKGECK
ncbi:MAG: pilin [Candidatus Altiarchaeota archaeon]